MLFLQLFTCKQFRSILNSPRHKCVQREIFSNIGITPVFNLTADDKGERGENLKGNISLYTVVFAFRNESFF